MNQYLLELLVEYFEDSITFDELIERVGKSDIQCRNQFVKLCRKIQNNLN